MTNKIINVEIPVYNRDDVFNTCFLKGLKYLVSLKDYIDISILYNGPNITEEFISNSNTLITQLGFELFYDKLQPDELANDIVQIRDRVHQISKKDYPLILQLDDDIEILSDDYTDIFRAAARKMLEYPNIGVVCFQKEGQSEKQKALVPATENSRQYTSGGLLLKNIKEWDSLYPDEAKQLHGSWSDILVSYVRLKKGLGVFQCQNPYHNHYEVRKKLNRKPGFSAHKWGEFYRSTNSSVMWLKKQSIQASGGMPPSLLKAMWISNEPIVLTKEDLKNTNLPIYKKLAIEIPSCNRNDALFKYLLPSLKHLVNLKDQIVLCFNYNGAIDAEKRAAANKIIEDLGFEYYWRYGDYHFEKGKTETIRMREDAHLYPDAKYSLILDDDIEFVSEKYANELVKCLHKLDDDDTIGAICFCKPMRNDKKIFGEFYELPPKTHAWMDGGIVLRNIKDWNGIFPQELRHLYGTGEDRLCLTVRANKGLKIYRYYSNQVLHWEHHDKDFQPGRTIYDWDNKWNEKGSILNYFSSLGFGQNRWVYINAKPIIVKKDYKPKRILNIELPVCDKDTFLKRLFLSLKYLKPISEYCYFVINYQKSFTKNNMKMINKYLTNLGFEVISTYSEYDFDKTNHSIMKIRNDTHMLKPDTPFSLLIDSDIKIKNENYAKDLLACLYYMANNNDIGVIGLENDDYHWFKRSKKNMSQTIVATNMSEHIFGTGCGLLVRNIKDWNGYLVPPFLSEKIGRHQDTLTVFERFCLGLEVYSCSIDSATTLRDFNNNRGKYLYGWAKTSNDIHSIDFYLKNWLLPEYPEQKDLFITGVYPKKAYWDNKPNFNYSALSIVELQAKLNEVIL